MIDDKKQWIITWELLSILCFGELIDDITKESFENTENLPTYCVCQILKEKYTLTHILFIELIDYFLHSSHYHKWQSMIWRLTKHSVILHFCCSVPEGDISFWKSLGLKLTSEFQTVKAQCGLIH